VSGKTITRADLIESIHQRIGLSRIECGELLELVLKEVTDCLERGETAKLSSFGSFVVRKKAHASAAIRKPVGRCRSRPGVS
jgi:integration host factor subunit alpha